MTMTVSVDDDADEGNGAMPAGSIRSLEWLPILDSSGRRLVGLDELFTIAHLTARIDVRAPIEKAGVLRFLTTVTALIARAQAITPQTAEQVARDGFDPAAVSSVLDSIDDRLWLIHPRTPFMQEGRFRAATSTKKTAASIRSTSPGDSSKAWWGRPGDGFATGELDLLSAPAALMGFWFYSVNGNGAVVLDGISVPVQGSAAGKVIAAGVRLWKTGENLAATLLMNTPQDWVTGTALPAWAHTVQTSGQLDPLIAATITGNATLLLLDDDPAPGSVVFVGAHVGSALRRGIPPSAADFADLTAAKSRNKNLLTENKRLKAAGEAALDAESLPVLGVDALKGSLIHAWRDDPQVVFRRPDPKKNKGMQKDEDIRALNNVDASTSVLHNLHGWYLRAFNPEVPGRRSILVRRDFTAELFSIQFKQKGSYGELSGASWLSMPPGTIGGSLAVQDALARFADFAYDRVQSALYFAVRTVVADRDGKVSKADAPFITSTHEYAVARFSVLADDVVSDVIALAIAEKPFTAVHVRAWSAAAIAAFDEAIEPFVTSRRLPDIALARQKLISALYKTESE